MSYRSPAIETLQSKHAFERIEAVSRMLWRYILPLAIALFLSLFYFAKYQPEAEDPRSDTTLQGAVASMVTGLATESDAAGEAVRALLTGEPRGLPEESPGHAEKPRSQRLDQLLLKVCVVVSLSILWFMTFIVANEIKEAWGKNQRLRRRPWGLRAIRWTMVFVSILPAIPFILSMRGAYEPAVFVMALVAIFMAAEHFGGLRESKQELEEKTRDITEQIGLVLNADGLAEWRAELYGLYSKAKRRIDAVIRYFDIDEAWWRCARSSTPWRDYEDLCKNDADTLFGALIAEKCEANIQFVSDFPMPFRGAHPAGRQQRAAYFRSFLGLTFNLVIFEKVRQRRSPVALPGIDDDDEALTLRFFPYSRIIISHAPSWMHVIDDIVFQVIERGTAEDSTVRRLTQGAINPKTRLALNEWARRNVRQFAHRGARAEEHVCAVLRYQAIKNPEVAESASLNEWALKIILNDLGMDDFLDLPNGEFRILTDETDNKPHEGRGSLLLSKAEAASACVQVFTEFLTQRMSNGVLALSVPTSDPPQVQELIYEVM